MTSIGQPDASNYSGTVITRRVQYGRQIQFNLILGGSRDRKLHSVKGWKGIGLGTNLQPNINDAVAAAIGIGIVDGLPIDYYYLCLYPDPSCGKTTHQQRLSALAPNGHGRMEITSGLSGRQCLATRGPIRM